jgi:hypothetical protein
VNWSKGVNYSDGINKSYGIFNCNGVSNNFFNANTPEKFFIFNKEVSKDRYDEVVDIFKKTSNNFIPQFNNLEELYNKFGDLVSTPIQAVREIQKEEAWKGLPLDAINYLKSLPEFDAEIFFAVTGINVTHKIK